MLSRALPRLLTRRTWPCVESSLLPMRSVVHFPGLITRNDISRSLNYSGHALQRRLFRRPFSTPAPHINHSDLPMDRYHVLADVTMVSLLEQLEDLLDEIANEAFEVDYHSGVLTLNLGSNGTYVINKQPPNKQIWLSSPVSGPKRYDYVPSTDDWRYSRDEKGLGDLLEQELSHALGRKVTLGLEHISQAID